VHAGLLRNGEPQRIDEVAVRWGFFHPSRFDRQYRQRFGELPSDTVHGSPR
jgi:transcriptional regulator GlxA family with amidase domain